MQSFLDEKLRATPMHTAVFLDRATHTSMEELRQLETYNSQYHLAAETWSQTHSSEKLEISNPKTNQKTIGGFAFAWDGKSWIHTAPTFQLEIDPNCDKKDAEDWIKKFKPIACQLLNRATVKRETLTFRLGCHLEKKCVAAAAGNTISFPFCENESHLLACCLSRASHKAKGLKPVALQNIILHEIGHTLKHYFSHQRELIIASVSSQIKNGEKLLGTISPHYLGEQHQNITNKFALLKTLGETDTTEAAQHSEYATLIGREIFAEMVRYYYLEPCLSKKLPRQPNSSYGILNQFAKDLLEQAKWTLKKTIGKPPLGSENLE